MLDPQKVSQMIQACESNNLHIIQQLLNENEMYARQQDESDGRSPLMAAHSNRAVAQLLLEKGAPWNAVDRRGKCAGDYATQAEQWPVVDLLVEWGTRAELILGAVERGKRGNNNDEQRDAGSAGAGNAKADRPVQHEPSTKPNYLRQRLQYTENGQALLDADNDAVMMEWERPLMKAHAQILMEGPPHHKTVMNIGFGLGIIDMALQAYQPAHHIIVEAHPDVYKRMIAEGWDKKENVRICFGRWQEQLPLLINEGLQIDAIFYDTYGEHFLDLEDFHALMFQLLSRPHGIYSFFNGLAPDNLFFHGVACQCVKLQLGELGLDSEFLSCEIQVKDSVWEGIRRKYWHGRTTYYLPRVSWNPQLLAGLTPQVSKMKQNVTTVNKDDNDDMIIDKRQRTT